MRARAFSAAAALGTALAGAGPAAALTLYDAALGSLPSDQGWSVLALGAPAVQSVAAGTYSLNTAGDGVVIFGNGRLSPLVLDTNAGFDLAFSLQLQGETHSSANRAGYSVLAVGAQGTHAVEVAFWSDHVWVYDFDASQSDPFVHGADIAFDTASSLRTYTLSVRHQQFTLSSQGTHLLAGALRDYAPGSTPFPPYSTPNSLFFGDDTSRGSSVTRLGFVSVTEVPEPASVALLLAGLAAGWVCRTRRPIRDPDPTPSHPRSVGGRRTSAATREKPAPLGITACAQGAYPGLVGATKRYSVFARFASTPSAAHAPSPRDATSS